MKTTGSNLLYLIIPLLFLTHLSNSQTITFIDDSININYGVVSGLNELDSIAQPKIYSEQYSEWKVYFDKEQTRLAFESNLKGDTCSRIDYWRNGVVKQKSIFIKGEHNIFNLWYIERYCLNGQLITKFHPNKNKEKIISSFYCSGKKRSESYNPGGYYIEWYENGQKKSERMGFKNNDEEWKYWDEKGNLKK